jgi:hypothetical protein
VGLFKALFKLTLVLVLGAALFGVLTLAKRGRDGRTLSFDEWPDVAQNPAA